VYKAIVVPHRLALVGDLAASLSEIRIAPFMQPTVSGVYFNVRLGGGADVQITRRLAIGPSASITVPAYASPGLRPGTTFINVGGQLLVAIKHWDLSASFYVDDVTHTRSPFGAIGFTHRWGG
jgi:hypothetical protein